MNGSETEVSFNLVETNNNDHFEIPDSSAIPIEVPAVEAESVRRQQIITPLEVESGSHLAYLMTTSPPEDFQPQEESVTKTQLNLIATEKQETLQNDNVTATDEYYDLADQLTSTIFPRSTNRTVRIVLTVAACLLAFAGCLSIMVAERYRLLIGTFWVILLSGFVGLVWFVQNAVLNRQHPFHPAVHAAADWVVQEYHNFLDDWHNADQFMLLANESNNKKTVEPDTGPFDPQENNLPEKKPKKPKSVLFRTLVKPILSLNFRRKRRKQQEKKQKRKQYTAPDLGFGVLA